MAENNSNRTARKKPVVVQVSDMGRLQPQARDLEQAVLGALMLEQDAFFKVNETLKPESFYERAHRLIYQAIVDLAARQYPIDMLTVIEQLKKNGDLEAIGGPLYISQLTENVGGAAHLERHAQIVAEKFLARELIRYTGEIQGKAYDETIEVKELMQEAEGELFRISQQNIRNEAVQINPIIKEARELLERAANRKEGLSGLPTGFADLDKITSGWQNSDLVIIAARPAMGKTAFVLSMARNMAVTFKVPVAMFSL